MNYCIISQQPKTRSFNAFKFKSIMNALESIQKIKNLSPNSIDELLNIFPWQLFNMDYTLSSDDEADTIISQNVTIGAGAEVDKLIVAETVKIEAGAEIHGTIICRKVVFSENSECNYLIAEELIAGKDSEIRFGVIQNSLVLEEGVEIDEIEACHSIKVDMSNQATIKKIIKLEQENWDKIIPERIQVILSTILN
jgi:hypothetical protein